MFDEFVADQPPSRGPLSGLAAALAKIQGSHLLALAIDMPFMSETHLRSLCARAEPGRGVLPRIDNRAELLVAIYPSEVRDAAALSGNDFSLQGLTRGLVRAGRFNVTDVSRAEVEFYRNLNEPADLL